jgi:uncharacterized protein YndB with AHSA1/START domain
MLKKILIGVAALVAIFVVVVATRPATYTVERSATVAAPPATVFALVDDFQAWERWSPWEDLDPNMKRTFGGPPSGVGARYGWVGNEDVGEGEMTIVASRPPEAIDIDLHFVAPFESSSRTEFRFQPDGDGTKVTWRMTGENNFVSKAFTLFMDMDAMIGGDFEKGLAGLDTAATSAK